MVFAVLPPVLSSNNDNNVGFSGLSDNGTLKTLDKYIELVLSSLLITVIVSCCH